MFKIFSFDQLLDSISKTNSIETRIHRFISIFEQKRNKSSIKQRFVLRAFKRLYSKLLN